VRGQPGNWLFYLDPPGLEARSVLAWLAVEEVGHPAAEVARFLGISSVGVLLSLEKARNICQKYEFELTLPNLTDSIR
jgi:hypothetical protein